MESYEIEAPNYDTSVFFPLCMEAIRKCEFIGGSSWLISNLTSALCGTIMDIDMRGCTAWKSDREYTKHQLGQFESINCDIDAESEMDSNSSFLNTAVTSSIKSKIPYDEDVTKRNIVELANFNMVTTWMDPDFIYNVEKDNGTNWTISLRTMLSGDPLTLALLACNWGPHFMYCNISNCGTALADDWCCNTVRDSVCSHPDAVRWHTKYDVSLAFSRTRSKREIINVICSYCPSATTANVYKLLVKNNVRIKPDQRDAVEKSLYSNDKWLTSFQGVFSSNTLVDVSRVSAGTETIKMAISQISQGPKRQTMAHKKVTKYSTSYHNSSDLDYCSDRPSLAVTSFPSRNLTAGTMQVYANMLENTMFYPLAVEISQIASGIKDNEDELNYDIIQVLLGDKVHDRKLIEQHVAKYPLVYKGLQKYEMYLLCVKFLYCVFKLEFVKYCLQIFTIRELLKNGARDYCLKMGSTMVAIVESEEESIKKLTFLNNLATRNNSLIYLSTMDKDLGLLAESVCDPLDDTHLEMWYFMIKSLVESYKYNYTELNKLSTSIMYVFLRKLASTVKTLPEAPRTPLETEFLQYLYSMERMYDRQGTNGGFLSSTLPGKYELTPINGLRTIGKELLRCMSLDRDTIITAAGLFQKTDVRGNNFVHRIIARTNNLVKDSFPMDVLRWYYKYMPFPFLTDQNFMGKTPLDMIVDRESMLECSKSISKDSKDERMTRNEIITSSLYKTCINEKNKNSGTLYCWNCKKAEIPYLNEKIWHFSFPEGWTYNDTVLGIPIPYKESNFMIDFNS